MYDELALQIARDRVDCYRHHSDEVIERHRKATDCRDCEAFLQLGIDAYEWLIRADQSIRRAVFKGDLEWDADIDTLFKTLFEQWLEPCEWARRWLNTQVERGYDVDNGAQFLECCEQVEAIVESFEEAPPVAIAKLQDDALAEYRNGETAEFV